MVKIKYKSNRHLTFELDPMKSYVYAYDGKKSIGIFMWDYKKKKWIFEEAE